MTDPESLTFVTYEDRETDCIGLKLLAVSLLQGNERHQLICFCPKSFTAFRAWAGPISGLVLRDADELTVNGWEVKPTILLKLLDEGVKRPIWIDGDIIFTRALNPALFEIADDQLLSTEENFSHATIDVDRTAMSGLKTARRLKYALNSGVVRVSVAHRELLKAWAGRMAMDDFQQARRDTKPRPTHIAGDQDVLEALICSTEFAHIPIRQLKAGVDIAQCWAIFGFAFHHQLRALFLGLPPLVHALGTKPWRVSGDALTHVSSELNPYCGVAGKYVQQIQENPAWLRPRSKAALMLNICGLGSPVLPGMLLQIIIASYKLILPVARFLRLR